MSNLGSYKDITLGFLAGVAVCGAISSYLSSKSKDVKKTKLSLQKNNKSNVENDKIDIIDVSWLCAQSIHRHLNGISISELYNEQTFNEKIKEIEFI